ncbi:hypothetical protein FACS189472_15150 [Alphaproteobacteria bacterium]|nr:hypothetical protein FACS189472_15150 [Alphaproteobacteria bacterium]
MQRVEDAYVKRDLPAAQQLVKETLDRVKPNIQHTLSKMRV